MSLDGLALVGSTQVAEVSLVRDLPRVLDYRPYNARVPIPCWTAAGGTSVWWGGGDVLVFPGHAALYIGNGRTAETVTGKGVGKSTIWSRLPQRRPQPGRPAQSRGGSGEKGKEVE